MTRLLAEDVSVELPIHSINSFSLKKKLIHLGTGGRIQSEAKTVLVRALQNVSFEAEDSDRIGVIGLNGAGKTTLLRTLAGIYQPVSGRVVAEGRVLPLLTVGLGMYEDVSGWENIRHCGLHMGMTVAEIEAKREEIAAFTELGDYLSLPVFSYSAGMRTRLSFAVATAVDAEILLLDEVIGAGDALFRDKAVARLKNMLTRTRIVVLASHSESWILQLCNKTLLLNEGRVLDYGKTADVMATYRKMVSR